MRQRCRDPKQKYWHRYGGRGIRVCTEWQSNFTTFRDWALCSGYREDLTLDRIDNDGNYEPNNCRWATAKEQHANRCCSIKTTEHLINVGIHVTNDELQKMKFITGENSNGRAVRTLAYKGLELEQTTHNHPSMNTTTEEKISVGVNVPSQELAEMKRVTCVDLSGPAVLALARKGLAAELAKEETHNKGASQCQR